ncbi:MAG: hypothetical protein LC667_19265 [Thioalkalivibrio sp.]|nr:hypothetical protein [Thioalkalivibrio sp.]
MEHNLSSEQLQILPELAILAALAAVLHTTITTLHAAHPDLSEHESQMHASEPFTASVCAAEAIVDLADTLISAIDRYQRANHHLIHVGSPPCSIDDPF